MTADIRERAEPHLHFLVGGEHYALPEARLVDVVPDTQPVPFPEAVRGLRGVVHRDGLAIPVVDLPARLGQALRMARTRPTVLVVRVNAGGWDAQVGLTVDVVGDALHLSPRDVVPAPPFGAAQRMDFLVGMGRHETGLVLLVDVDRLLPGLELSDALERAARVPPGGT
jgi:purine-binding chemotaxis protein CheW